MSAAVWCVRSQKELDFLHQTKDLSLQANRHRPKDSKGLIIIDPMAMTIGIMGFELHVLEIGPRPWLRHA